MLPHNNFHHSSLPYLPNTLATMSCENCFKGYILPGEPSGSIVDGAYLHAASSPAPGPKRAVVLFTDIFGLDLVNCKIQADLLSEKLNMDVWVPDLFDGTLCRRVWLTVRSCCTQASRR